MSVFVWVAIFALISGWWIAFVLQNTFWAMTCGISLVVYLVWIVVLTLLRNRV